LLPSTKTVASIKLPDHNSGKVGSWASFKLELLEKEKKNEIDAELMIRGELFFFLIGVIILLVP
jgi:hypothetical protein